MENHELIQSLNKDLAIALPEDMAYDALHKRLSAYINELIKKDFERLVAYLYRIDVNEAKLKSLLQHFPQEDAGDIIASLILERQAQKIKTRQAFGQNSNEDGGEEKW